MIAKSLLCEVLEAVEAFDARDLWDRFENFHCFAIHVEGEAHPVVASVMGAGEEQFGLMLLRGPYAATCFAALTSRSVRVAIASPYGACIHYAASVTRDAPPNTRYSRTCLPSYSAKLFSARSSGIAAAVVGSPESHTIVSARLSR